MEDKNREINNILESCLKMGFILDVEGISQEGFKYYQIKNKTNGSFLIKEIF